MRRIRGDPSGMVVALSGGIGGAKLALGLSRVLPSERLIVVRFGRSPNLPPEADGVYQLVQDVIAATSHSGRSAAGN